MKKTAPRVALDLLIIAIGTAIYAYTVTTLLDPYNIVPGGVTGIAMLLCHIFPILPLGMTILAINIPLFLLSWRLLGHKFLLYTGFGTLMLSVFIELMKPIGKIETQPLLAGVFGGLLSGVGLGLVFLRGATTGGSDIIARLLKIPFPHMQMGRLMLIFDGAVVAASGIIFGSVDSMLYAVITVFIAAKTMDALLYGMNVERVAYIISDSYGDIVKAIDERLERGATLLHGEGGFGGAPKKVILVAVKRQQIALLKGLVREIDPSAFMILSEAGEVLGEGFADYHRSSF